MIVNKEQYPRPDFIREDYLDLNGLWKFSFDDKNIGEQERWFEKGIESTRTIKVPFCYQSEASTITDKGYHEILWYEKTIYIEEGHKDLQCLLHFGAVDYVTKVWINGDFAGSHVGGNCSFTLDITQWVKYGEDNTIIVRVKDTRESWQPRGKQFWGEKGERIWYTPVSGIWKSVWIEFTGDLYVKNMLITPDIDQRHVKVEVTLNRFTNKEVWIHADISHEGSIIKKIRVTLPERISQWTVDLTEQDYADEIHWWTPESPWLYDMDICIYEEETPKDQVSGYFGMRKISIKGDQILLNNKPYYQKLILDQGYWEDTLLTPPDAAALEKDILLAKKMGFNGARKHQKVEDARYYYLAAKLGFLVWGEMPSAYKFCTQEMDHIISEWKEFIVEAYNHPSIIMWVPLNESWGVRNIAMDQKQQRFAAALFELTKAYDSTRLVSNNDGWEQVSQSDICSIHDYTAKGYKLEEKFLKMERVLKGASEHRLIYAKGHEYTEKPILLTEFGGIAFVSEDSESWGYYGAVESEMEFYERFQGIVEGVSNSEKFCGYCYTQLTDVFQEANGLVTFNRKPKVDIVRIKEINDGIS